MKSIRLTFDFGAEQQRLVNCIAEFDGGDNIERR